MKSLIVAVVITATSCLAQAQSAPTDEELQAAYRTCRLSGFGRPVIDRKNPPPEADKDFTESCIAIRAEITKRANAKRDAHKDSDRQSVKDIGKMLTK